MLYKARIKLRINGLKFEKGDTVPHQKGKLKDGFSKEEVADMVKKGYIYDAEAELKGYTEEDDGKTPGEGGSKKPDEEPDNQDQKTKNPDGEGQ